MPNTAQMELEARERQFSQTLQKHLENGVVFFSREVYIDPEVVIAPGAQILPGTILRGKTVIGADCVVGPYSLLEDTVLEDGCQVNASQVYSSTLGRGTRVGPFAHLRPDTQTGPQVHLGAFVETKNSQIGHGTTVSHLTYVGDSDVGEYCNFGCGTVTSNYDGEEKHRCRIGNYAFIGCNTNLIAPVTLGDECYTAAGSTITGEVPAGALAVARSRQQNKEGWARKKLAAYVAKKRKLKSEGK